MRCMRMSILRCQKVPSETTTAGPYFGVSLLNDAERLMMSRYALAIRIRLNVFIHFQSILGLQGAERYFLFHLRALILRRV